MSAREQPSREAARPGRYRVGLPRLGHGGAGRCRGGRRAPAPGRRGRRVGGNNRARSTRRAYAGDFTHFAQWCATMGTRALPASAEAVYLYLTALVADANAAEYSPGSAAA